MLVFFIFRSMSSSMSSMSRCKTLQTRSSIGLEIEKSSLPTSSEASMWTSNIRHPFVFVSLMLFSSFSSSEKRVSFVFFVFLDDDELDCIGGLIPFEANSFFFFLPPSVKVALRLLLELRNEKERKQERRVGRGHHRYHESFVVVVIPFVFRVVLMKSLLTVFSSN